VNILYFSSVGWDWIHQRPHFLAKELAKAGHQVTFLSIGASTERMSVQEGLRVVQMRRVRGYMRSGFLRRGLQIRLNTLINLGEYSRIILTNPVQFELFSAKSLSQFLCYDCMDFLPEFYRGRTKRQMLQWEERLCRRASRVIASSAVIGEWLQEQYGLQQAPVMIRNGYDPAAFAELSPTAEAKTLGYMGTLDEKWFDLPSVLPFARAHPDWSIHLVGPASPALRKQLSSHSNVVFHGAMPHREALAVMAKVKVVMIPFIRNHLIDGVDPVKLYEYLALGKPVVSTFWESLRPFAAYENLQFYQDATSFEAQVLACSHKRYQVPEGFSAENSLKTRARAFLSTLTDLEGEDHEADG